LIFLNFCFTAIFLSCVHTICCYYAFNILRHLHKIFNFSALIKLLSIFLSHSESASPKSSLLINPIGSIEEKAKGEDLTGKTTIDLESAAAVSPGLSHRDAVRISRDILAAARVEVERLSRLNDGSSALAYDDTEGIVSSPQRHSVAVSPLTTNRLSVSSGGFSPLSKAVKGSSGHPPPPPFSPSSSSVFMTELPDDEHITDSMLMAFLERESNGPNHSDMEKGGFEQREEGRGRGRSNHRDKDMFRNGGSNVDVDVDVSCTSYRESINSTQTSRSSFKRERSRERVAQELRLMQYRPQDSTAKPNGVVGDHSMRGREREGAQEPKAMTQEDKDRQRAGLRVKNHAWLSTGQLGEFCQFYASQCLI
jgi:hypothetical protein